MVPLIVLVEPLSDFAAAKPLDRAGELITMTSVGLPVSGVDSSRCYLLSQRPLVLVALAVFAFVAHFSE